MIEDYLKEFNSKKRYSSIYKPHTINIESGDTNSLSNWRYILPYILVLVIFSVIIYNLIVLQIFEGDQNAFLASANYKQQEVIKAPRGLIYDRNGTALVYNIPSFRIMLDNKYIMSKYVPGNESDLEVIEGEYITTTSKVLDMPEERFREIYLKNSRSLSGDPVLNNSITLLKELNKDQVLGLYSSIQKIEGLYVSIDEHRLYQYPELLAHVIGYTGDVSVSDLVNDPSLTYIDEIGKTGLEEYYDEILRGTNGVKIAEQDIANNSVSEYTSKYVVRGDDIYLYLDIEMQRKLDEVLTKNLDQKNNLSASAAIIDIKTGGIMAMVSHPTYNTNDLNDRIAEYLTDDRNVLMNRFTSAYPPGSTFKTFTGSILLQENVIDTNTRYQDRGTVDLGGGFRFVNYNSRVLGNLDITGALSLSSNLFFCNYSLTIDQSLFTKYAKGFRIGEYTNIDIPFESKGLLSNAENKLTLSGEPWYPGDNCNLAIGQGYTKVTPVQMLAWVSAIARDGSYIEPRFAEYRVNSINNKGTTFQTDQSTELGISKENLAIVQKGMRMAVNQGVNGYPPTAGLINSKLTNVAAKTGTAESTVRKDGIWERDTIGWVMGYLPYEDPKYAFVLMIEGGDASGGLSTRVIREYIDWFAEYEGL